MKAQTAIPKGLQISTYDHAFMLGLHLRGHTKVLDQENSILKSIVEGGLFGLYQSLHRINGFQGLWEGGKGAGI
jgi:hypothetical protein